LSCLFNRLSFHRPLSGAFFIMRVFLLVQRLLFSCTPIATIIVVPAFNSPFRPVLNENPIQLCPWHFQEWLFLVHEFRPPFFVPSDLQIAPPPMSRCFSCWICFPMMSSPPETFWRFLFYRRPPSNPLLTHPPPGRGSGPFSAGF